MKMIKFLPHAGIIAVLAGVMQFMDIKIALFCAWVGFAAWACYFLNGCTIKGGLKVIGCWVAGVIASVGIIELGKFLTGTFGGNAAVGFPVAVSLIAFLVILFEKVPALDFIPGWFVGAACFFGYNTIAEGNYAVSVPVILVSCVIGQVFGYVTVALRTAYAKASEPVAEAEAAS
ncbi:hypothetical protein PDESU_02300 [Pontiella desulfatans]|uniref:DUF1097 domain-containing protein n=1 Tax=Pontiella desulfatans TaxID=2750659 RepID=A0A6C2U1I4_PONDE|nr:DUF1097 domain-containing protein [Pontiella desulfatans]VGO13743.1 hypothetical protein PDESU_02300 [Pontiella desulfatans]